MFERFTSRFQNFFSSQQNPVFKKESPVVRLFPIGTYNRPNDNYQTYAKDGYMEQPVIYRCVNLIAQNAAAVKLSVFVNNEMQENHPLLDLLENPNPIESRVEFFQALYSYILLSGNNYIQRVFEGDTRELWLLRPDRVTINAGTRLIPNSYDYYVDGVLERRFEVDAITGESDIKQTKLFNPVDDFYGLSPLSAAALEADIFSEIDKLNHSLLKNSLTPSGILKYSGTREDGIPHNLTEEQVDRIKGELRARVGSLMAGEALFLEGEFDWIQLSLNPRDMSFSNLKDTSTRNIANVFGVPGQLLGLPDSQTYSNYKEAREALYKDTIQPLAERVESDLNEFISPLFGDNVEVRYDFDSVPVLADLKRENDKDLVALVQSGLLTINEARMRMELDEIEGGDETFIPGNLFPLSEPTIPPADGNNAESDGEDAFGNED